MFRRSKSLGPLVLRLLAALALLGCPRMGFAAGTWSVIAPPPKPGEVYSPSALAADAAGNLYVADMAEVGKGRIHKRDTQGSWSVIATGGDAPGQVDGPTALAVDTAGNLYIADLPGGDYFSGRIQKRDTQGNWSVIADSGSDLGQVSGPRYLAVDTAGNLYVAEHVEYPPAGGFYRIQRRDAGGNWSEIANGSGSGGFGQVLGQVLAASGLAVDTAGNLYVADQSPAGGGYGRIQKRDAQGTWSEIATADQVSYPTGLAVDAAGDLYVAERYDSNAAAGTSRIEKRDAQGSCSVIATSGAAIGQVNDPRGLAVDAAGNLYVADTGNDRVQEYSPSGGP